MSRALIAVVVLIGLTGCSFPLGQTGPSAPPLPQGLGGPPPIPPRGSMALSGGGILTDDVGNSYVQYGAFAVSGTESSVAIPLPTGGTLSKLEVFVSTAPGTGASWTLTLDKNESATALTCSIAGPWTGCRDSSLVTVGAGDQIDLAVTPFGRPARATITWSARITP